MTHRLGALCRPGLAHPWPCSALKPEITPHFAGKATRLSLRMQKSEEPRDPQGRSLLTPRPDQQSAERSRVWGTDIFPLRSKKSAPCPQATGAAPTSQKGCAAPTHPAPDSTPPPSRVSSLSSSFTPSSSSPRATSDPVGCRQWGAGDRQRPLAASCLRGLRLSPCTPRYSYAAEFEFPVYIIVNPRGRITTAGTAPAS